MAGDLEANGAGASSTTTNGDTSGAIHEDTQAISSETKDLVIEAKSSLVILICGILAMSLLSILLSTWLAKTITNTSSSFSTILGRYFGFDRNDTEENLTWWKPMHAKATELTGRQDTSNKKNSSTNPVFIRIPYNDYPRFHTIVLPLFFVGAFICAAIAYYARVKCTARGFAWGAVPKVPLGRVDPRTTAAAVAAVVKAKDAEPGVDYTIVQGTKEEPAVFTLAETLQPLNEERDAGAVVDEGTQYESEDIPKTITHISSAPDLQTNNQTVPSTVAEQQHAIELLQRSPLPTLSPSVQHI